MEMERTSPEPTKIQKGLNTNYSGPGKLIQLRSAGGQGINTIAESSIAKKRMIQPVDVGEAPLRKPSTFNNSIGC